MTYLLLLHLVHFLLPLNTDDSILAHSSITEVNGGGVITLTCGQCQEDSEVHQTGVHGGDYEDMFSRRPWI